MEASFEVVKLGIKGGIGFCLADLAGIGKRSRGITALCVKSPFN
jgi:hypothetical protein